MLKSIDLFFDKQSGSQLVDYIQSNIDRNGDDMNDDKNDNESEMDIKQIDKMHIYFMQDI